MNPMNDKERILYSYAIEPTHDRTTLEKYINNYPQLTNDLIDLTTELRAVDFPESEGLIEDPGLEAAWQTFATAQPAGATADPFERFKGPAFAQLASLIDVPRAFLMAFRDGLVTTSSTPSRFLSRLASAMETTEDALRRGLARPQMGSARIAYKSETKPTTQGQCSFGELVTNTQMSDEQRRTLLQDCQDDGFA